MLVSPWANIQSISNGIKGVSGGRWNAKLCYETLTSNSGFEYDEYGNPVASPPSRELRCIFARLYPARGTEYAKASGVDQSKLYMVGCLVEPLEIPNPPPNIVNAQISGYTGFWTWSTQLETSTSIESQLEKALGQRISGYFQISQGY